MFESPTRDFLGRLRQRSRGSSETTLYFNPRESQGAIATDTLAWIASLFFALACNQPLWQQALLGRSWSVPATWGFAAALLVVLTTTHFVLLALLLHRAFAKALLGGLLVLTAVAVHYMQLRAGHLDPPALRQMLGLEPGAWPAVLGSSLLMDLAFYAGVPLLVLWRVKLARRAWPQALGMRVTNLVVALLLGAGSLLATADDFEALRREDPSLRYLITPANLLFSVHRLFTRAPAPELSSWAHKTISG